MMTASHRSPSTSSTNQRPSRMKIWFMAARPRTLPASIAPIFLGTAVAIHQDGFHALTAIMALITAMLLQIAANFANDALDFKRGADTAERTGPTRITSSGLVSADAVLRATAITLGLAVLSGLYLVWRGGWPFLVLGIAALICAVAYTGGPYPIAYLGLGEIFVFIFFGLIAVSGTAYLQTLEVTSFALAAAIPAGAMSIGILVVNNLRDLDQDRIANKRTLAVRFGRVFTLGEYVTVLVITMLTPFAFWVIGWLNAWALLTSLSWPLFFQLARQIFTTSGFALNATLGATGRTLFAFSILLSAALILST